MTIPERSEETPRPWKVVKTEDGTITIGYKDGGHFLAVGRIYLEQDAHDIVALTERVEELERLNNFFKDQMQKLFEYKCEHWAVDCMCWVTVTELAENILKEAKEIEGGK
jgi:hypothetical protein